MTKDDLQYAPREIDHHQIRTTAEGHKFLRFLHNHKAYHHGILGYARQLSILHYYQLIFYPPTFRLNYKLTSPRHTPHTRVHDFQPLIVPHLLQHLSILIACFETLGWMVE